MSSRYGHVLISLFKPAKISEILYLFSETIPYNDENIDVNEGSINIKVDPQKYKLVIYYEPPRIPKSVSRNVIVTTTPGEIRVGKIFGWKKAFLKRIEGYDFILSIGSMKFGLVIKPGYIGLKKGVSGIYKKALTLLRKGVVEYGFLSTRDAVDIISYNLNVKRDEARKILSYLARKGYVKVVKGEVLVY
ncbi:hypothetical protein DRN86_04335 [Candidatus Geothermarchaeota archaeon]|nr:MAG: hypothetical protein DRN86_04335 [Candidatus Geothermarchaeota archaeon]